MHTSDVIELLKAHQNEKGIAHWNNLYPEKDSLKSFGIGLTVLRKLGKQIGRDHDLAEQLWQTDIYDAKIISLLIDNPKQMSIAQANSKIPDLKPGYLAHVFSSCDASLAKTPFVVELADQWILAEDTMRKSCGFGLLYEISKMKKKSAPSENYFMNFISHIQSNFKNENHVVQGAMLGALIGIGKRSRTLNQEALNVTKELQAYAKGKFQPKDILKHLTSSYIKNKLGIA